MKLPQKLLNKLNGLHYPQEYLCLAKQTFENSLRAFLVADGNIVKDITNDHVFTGYNPLIFTFHVPDPNESIQPGDQIVLPSSIEIFFCHSSSSQNGVLNKKDAVAHLSMVLIRKQSAGNTTVYHYEGKKGVHHFLSSFQQSILGLSNRLYNKREGNVYLHDNLYTQVQIAYAVPRIISLITVSDGTLYNLFPTDLHGPINKQFYVGSLRHAGKACKQVEAYKKIAISQVHCAAYKSVYALGKNHMQELRPKEIFPFGLSVSPVYGLALPKSVLQYRELELLESFEHGIHKIMLFKIVSEQAVSNEPATLAHVHNSFATWRYKQGAVSNFLLR